MACLRRLPLPPWLAIACVPCRSDALTCTRRRPDFRLPLKVGIGNWSAALATDAALVTGTSRPLCCCNQSRYEYAV